MLSSKRILINASNLHSGGGVQVAISFIYELSLIKEICSTLDVVASTDVANGLERLETNINLFSSFDIVNSHGVKALYSKLNNKIPKYDVVFTVFGPNYLRVKAKKEIVGFAQPWMLNFDNPISAEMSFVNRNLLRLKYYTQWLFFLRADHYIVELEHVKRGLVESKGVNEKIISVVHNTVSSLYLNRNQWKGICINKYDERISLGIVTRDYPHKNLKKLPLVAKELMDNHSLHVHFYTTLNDDEWATKDQHFKKYVSTVGLLTPDQCPSFYEQMDGVVFPSLLECFSATPLEAMVMSKPLFSSDRGFVKDVCGDYSIYFDPENPEDIAKKIADYFHSDTDCSAQLAAARNHALNFSSAKGRAEKYLEIIQQHIKD